MKRDRAIEVLAKRDERALLLANSLRDAGYRTDVDGAGEAIASAYDELVQYLATAQTLRLPRIALGLCRDLELYEYAAGTVRRIAKQVSDPIDAASLRLAADAIARWRDWAILALGDHKADAGE